MNKIIKLNCAPLPKGSEALNNPLYKDTIYIHVGFIDIMKEYKYKEDTFVEKRGTEILSMYQGISFFVIETPEEIMELVNPPKRKRVSKQTLPQVAYCSSLERNK